MRFKTLRHALPSILIVLFLLLWVAHYGVTISQELAAAFLKTPEAFSTVDEENHEESGTLQYGSWLEEFFASFGWPSKNAPSVNRRTQ
jgi:hypothetical protein